MLGGPTLSLGERARILKTKVKDYFIEIGDGVYEVETNGNGICPYLAKDKSCSIQKVKPLGCICWPILPELKNDKINCIIMHCPLTPYIPKRDIEKYKKECKKMPKKVIKAMWDVSTVTDSKELKIIERKLKKFSTKKLR
jgi:Fe-S-cluster containining protein